LATRPIPMHVLQGHLLLVCAFLRGISTFLRRSIRCGEKLLHLSSKVTTIRLHAEIHGSFPNARDLASRYNVAQLSCTSRRAISASKYCHSIQNDIVNWVLFLQYDWIRLNQCHRQLLNSPFRRLLSALENAQSCSLSFALKL
jgi:hypothetical protein